MLGALPGVIGTMQAMEAIKVLTGFGEAVQGRMLHYDAITARVREIKLKTDPNCALCSVEATITEPVVYEQTPCGLLQLKELEVSGVRSRLEGGFDGVLLDVRERDEHAWAHLEGARLAPLSEFMNHVDELPRDVPYLVYCKVGQRSAHAGQVLLEAGFQDVTNVSGGILAWLQEGYPVVTPH